MPTDKNKIQAAGAPRPQTVLVLQGGGALGAYQVGVYQALHEAGIEPDWVIGTSIGAINGALIAGNDPSHRLDRLNGFWDTLQLALAARGNAVRAGRLNPLSNLAILSQGIPGFFQPNPAALWGPRRSSAPSARRATAPRRWRARWQRSSTSSASRAGACG